MPRAKRSMRLVLEDQEMALIAMVRLPPRDCQVMMSADQTFGVATVLGGRFQLKSVDGVRGYEKRRVASLGKARDKLGLIPLQGLQPYHRLF